MSTALKLLVAFVALYPVVSAALWIAGGLMFRLLDEHPGDRPAEPDGGWPGVTILIPAFNEEAVIAISVRAALRSDYPRLEVLVLDDGSTDDTEAAAIEAAAGDPRCRVLRDPVNRGKAEQLNAGLAQAAHELVVVTDADTHLHPYAVRHLAARIESSPILAAVAGGPHVTNRDGFICAMQVLEAAAIIGLIRRTQSLTGRVGVGRRSAQHDAPRSGHRRRRLCREHGHRGHRPHVAAAHGRLADGVRAARPRRHAGPVGRCRRCGRSASAGRGDRGRSSMSTSARSAAGAITACGSWVWSRSHR